MPITRLRGIVLWTQSGSSTPALFCDSGLGCQSSYQRFPLVLRGATRIERKIHSSPLMRDRQTDRVYSGADDADLIAKIHKRLASKRTRVRWDDFGRKMFTSSARPATHSSRLPIHRHHATEAPHNHTSNMAHSAPDMKYHEGAVSHEISDGGDKMMGRSKYVTHKKSSQSKESRKISTKPSRESLLRLETEDSNGISGKRPLNQGRRSLSSKSAHEGRRWNTQGNVQDSRPRKESQSSLNTLEVQRGSHPLQPWQVQKRALLEKFGSSGWSPRKRLSPDVLESVRTLNSQSPEKYTTPVLAEQFKVSPEAIRRILKSKWRPSEEEEARRRLRWDSRGKAIWSQMVEIGIKPPKKWRAMGVKKKNEKPRRSTPAPLVL